MNKTDLARQLLDAVTTRAVPAAVEMRAWVALLQTASPEERREIAQAAWLDLRAYGYDPRTGARA